MVQASPRGQTPAGELRSVSASDGIKLEYEVLGGGTPIVLLHGGFAGRSAFARQRVLAERFRLIIPSSRGHDATDVTLPADFGFHSSEVDDVLSILDAEAVARTHVIGHSSGGATAFAFASRYPERVDRLVLIEPTLLALLPPPIRTQVTQEFEDIIRLGEREGNDAALRATIAWAGGEAWTRLEEAAQQARLQSLASLAPLPLPHGRALLNFPVTADAVQTLRPRTLLLYGTTSSEFEPAVAQRFRELRPDLPLVIAEGAGHNLHRERPDIVNPAITDFLAQ